MSTTRLNGRDMFSSTRRLRPRLSIPALISCFSSQQQQLECGLFIGPGADAHGMVVNDDRRRTRILASSIIDRTYLGGTGFDPAGAVAIDST